MDNTTGQTLIVDSDAVIALFNPEDSNHSKTQAFFESFYEQKTRLIYPATTLVETVDTIQRRLKKYEVSTQIAKLISNTEFATESIESIDGTYIKEAVKYFQDETSNRKTLADAIVVAVAKKLDANGIFGFDEWYHKFGYKLAEEMLKQTKAAKTKPEKVSSTKNSD